ncbi:MAG: hypothetical protein P4L11_03335 [Geothrix sp.]|nr:hypothetical protein [Geothrix sp.]
MSEDIDYGKVLDDLKAKLEEANRIKQQTQAEIQRLELAIAGVSPLAALARLDLTLPRMESYPLNLSPENVYMDNEFVNMSAVDAVSKYLKRIGKPKKSTEIADALKRGGYQTISKNLYTTVYTAMFRHPEIFEKTNEGWTLKEMI